MKGWVLGFGCLAFVVGCGARASKSGAVVASKPLAESFAEDGLHLFLDSIHPASDNGFEFQFRLINEGTTPLLVCASDESFVFQVANIDPKDYQDRWISPDWRSSKLADVDKYFVAVAPGKSLRLSPVARFAPLSKASSIEILYNGGAGMLSDLQEPDEVVRKALQKRAKATGSVWPKGHPTLRLVIPVSVVPK